MEKELLVTTEYLSQKREEWKELTKKAKQAFDQTGDGVKTLDGVFYGKPVLALKAEILSGKEQGKKEFDALLHHLEKLEVIAFIYDKVERENRGYIKTN